MKDTHYRSIIKAVSYRIAGSLSTVAISWALTRKVGIAVGIGVGDFVVKIILYYLHERFWDIIPFGKKPARPDYEI